MCVRGGIEEDLLKEYFAKLFFRLISNYNLFEIIYFLYSEPILIFFLFQIFL